MALWYKFWDKDLTIEVLRFAQDDSIFGRL